MFHTVALMVQALVTCQIPNMQLYTEFTYTGLDPLRLAQNNAFTTMDITNQPSAYWAQAVMIYWWDQVAVNLTQANIKNFNSSLQSVLLQGKHCPRHS
jgi:hypothetical protein